jgi:hypothetical protein
MKQTIKIVVFLTFLFYQQIILGESPSQVASFKKALQSNTQIANCANCDFRGTQDLAGVDAHGASLPGVTFQACIPNDSNKNSMMVCVPGQAANLTGINLANANLFSSCLDGAILDNADLSNADVSNSSAQYVSLKNAKVKGVITTNSTFCNAVMPDGAICTDTWTGQGVTIACNCTAQDAASRASVAATLPSIATNTTAPVAPVVLTSSPKAPIVSTVVAPAKLVVNSPKVAAAG